MQTRRSFHRLTMATAMFGAAPAAAQDQWPQRTIRIVVPYTPGSSTDSHSRRMAQELMQRVGQTVVVENRTGAAGTIGIAEVARARPDGYTLLGMDSGIMILPHLVRAMPVDVWQDLVPIAAYIFSPSGLIVNAASPYRTVQQLIEVARAEPGKLTFGSGGVGTPPHLAAETFAASVGVQLLSVPFRGAGEATQALLAGTIDILMVGMATAGVSLLGPGGRLRMLALGADRRLDLLPDVPTFDEIGIPGIRMGGWVGLFAPRGTSPEITDRLAREAVSIMGLPAMRTYAESVGGAPRIVVGTELAALMRSDSDRWKATIERIGLVPQ